MKNREKSLEGKKEAMRDFQGKRRERKEKYPLVKEEGKKG